MNNIVPKTKLVPFNMIKPQKNNFNIENTINYDSYLKHNKINSNKKNISNQPKYFYQRTKVKDNIDQVKHDIINSNNKNIETKESNLSGSKRYIKPLIKNQKLNTNENRDIDIDTMIRGEYSRLETPNFQKEREQVEDMRFQFLHKNFQDPDKLVLPFARGGEMTREKYNRNN